jgi:transposase-like protein
MRKQYTAEQREKLVAEVRDNGERVSVVAKRMGVTPSTAYLWIKAASVGVPSAPVFARVVPTRVATIRIEVGCAVVVVEADFNAELLRQVIVALSSTP